MTYDDIVQFLTAPGALFEIVTENVGGREMKSFRNRDHVVV